MGSSDYQGMQLQFQRRVRRGLTAKAAYTWSHSLDVSSGDRQGNLGRNALRGFNLSQTDLALGRSFRLRERSDLLFRAEMFNVMNHPNFADPISDLGNGLFGQSNAMAKDRIGGGAAFGLNSLFQVGGPRSVQLSLKLRF